MRSEKELEIAIDKYADMIRRVSFIHLKNYSDVEDVFQDVFLKYSLLEKDFESDEHEKAWLLRVAINGCKDILKSFFRKKVNSLDDVDLTSHAIRDEDKSTLDAVLRLPDKYRNVVYLHYYEGYTAVEIAEILGMRENTVYTWMSRARLQLKNVLGGEMSD